MMVGSPSADLMIFFENNLKFLSFVISREIFFPKDPFGLRSNNLHY